MEEEIVDYMLAAMSMTKAKHSIYILTVQILQSDKERYSTHVQIISPKDIKTG